MKDSLFANLNIAIDGNNYKDKQSVQKLVKENGGDVSFILNNKV
jgi:hypothetical protein